MQHRLKICLALVALLSTPTVFAKGTDTDGDGKFSKTEVTAQRQKQLDKKFEKFDTNQDGQLTMDEIKGKRGGIAKKADVNKDGVITKDEARMHLSGSIDNYFQKKDMNGDGLIDKDERKRKANKSASDKKKTNKNKSSKTGSSQ